ncbi:MAG: hypothetical protein PHO90_00740 [Candidatus Pacebacteria bacterium]|nr:hypothetical protein [Candidatus Paceibacterota bacterium]
MKRRRYAKRKRKKKSFLSKLFFGLALIVFSFGLGIFILYRFSPDMMIKGVEIVGGRTVSQDDIKDVAQELFVSSFNFLGREVAINNIFVSLEGKADKLLEQFPEIESVSIKKDYVKGLVYLEILEKEPAAVWCSNGNCSLVDGKGSFIRSCPREENNDLVLIEEKEKGSGLDKEEAVSASLYLNEKMKKYGLEAKIFSLFPDKLVLEDVRGCDFIFSPSDDFDWQVEKMEAVLDQGEYLNNLSAFQYIELRWGNQAVVKKKE